MAFRLRPSPCSPRLALLSGIHLGYQESLGQRKMPAKLQRSSTSLSCAISPRIPVLSPSIPWKWYSIFGQCCVDRPGERHLSRITLFGSCIPLCYSNRAELCATLDQVFDLCRDSLHLLEMHALASTQQGMEKSSEHSCSELAHSLEEACLFLEWFSSSSIQLRDPDVTYFAQVYCEALKLLLLSFPLQVDDFDDASTSNASPAPFSTSFQSRTTCTRRNRAFANMIAAPILMRCYSLVTMKALCDRSPTNSCLSALTKEVIVSLMHELFVLVLQHPRDVDLIFCPDSSGEAYSVQNLVVSLVHCLNSAASACDRTSESAFWTLLNDALDSFVWKADAALDREDLAWTVLLSVAEFCVQPDKVDRCLAVGRRSNPECNKNQTTFEFDHGDCVQGWCLVHMLLCRQLFGIKSSDTQSVKELLSHSKRLQNSTRAKDLLDRCFYFASLWKTVSTEVIGLLFDYFVESPFEGGELEILKPGYYGEYYSLYCSPSVTGRVSDAPKISSFDYFLVFLDLHLSSLSNRSFQVTRMMTTLLTKLIRLASQGDSDADVSSESLLTRNLFQLMLVLSKFMTVKQKDSLPLTIKDKINFKTTSTLTRRIIITGLFYLADSMRTSAEYSASSDCNSGWSQQGHDGAMQLLQAVLDAQCDALLNKRDELKRMWPIHGHSSQGWSKFRSEPLQVQSQVQKLESLVSCYVEHYKKYLQQSDLPLTSYSASFVSGALWDVIVALQADARVVSSTVEKIFDVFSLIALKVLRCSLNSRDIHASALKSFCSQVIANVFQKCRSLIDGASDEALLAAECLGRIGPILTINAVCTWNFFFKEYVMHNFSVNDVLLRRYTARVVPARIARGLLDTLTYDPSLSRLFPVEHLILLLSIWTHLAVEPFCAGQYDLFVKLKTLAEFRHSSIDADKGNPLLEFVLSLCKDMPLALIAPLEDESTFTIRSLSQTLHYFLDRLHAYLQKMDAAVLSAKLLKAGLTLNALFKYMAVVLPYTQYDVLRRAYPSIPAKLYPDLAYEYEDFVFSIIGKLFTFFPSLIYNKAELHLSTFPKLVEDFIVSKFKTEPLLRTCPSRSFRFGHQVKDDDCTNAPSASNFVLQLPTALYAIAQLKFAADRFLIRMVVKIVLSVFNSIKSGSSSEILMLSHLTCGFYVPEAQTALPHGQLDACVADLRRFFLTNILPWMIDCAYSFTVPEKTHTLIFVISRFLRLLLDLETSSLTRTSNVTSHCQEFFLIVYHVLDALRICNPNTQSSAVKTELYSWLTDFFWSLLSAKKDKEFFDGRVFAPSFRLLDRDTFDQMQLALAEILDCIATDLEHLVQHTFLPSTPRAHFLNSGLGSFRNALFEEIVKEDSDDKFVVVAKIELCDNDLLAKRKQLVFQLYHLIQQLRESGAALQIEAMLPALKQKVYPITSNVKITNSIITKLIQTKYEELAQSFQAAPSSPDL
ncbi:uncharacterized protein LOC126326585 isoform X2 [Schistocerca gregaria]|uniref:uncharacterized protein LOC126326585 isoform X2 n=1 Tax=Schistocerca gregaria TaxID=7010 RepID=UPI00211E3BEE|nr:uncharacterized protein LOC126326585 isoform X2 [Schistocerca gregaria]